MNISTKGYLGGREESSHLLNVRIENDEIAAQVPHNGYYFVILNNWVSSYQFPPVKDYHQKVQLIKVGRVRKD